MYIWCLLLFSGVSAQAPVSETIHANSIEAKVWSNGALFGYNNERAFKIPTSEEDATLMSVFRRVAPWMSGYDPYGNLKRAGGALTGTDSDFQPGVINVDGLNQIWKVTKADILAHRADFADNGIIDNPIDAITQWPTALFTSGFSNPNVLGAPFFDQNGNDVYDPMLGEFPYPNIGMGYFMPGIPDETLFFAFNDNGTHEVFQAGKMNMQVFCTVWAYSCPEEPAFNNSIFVTLEYAHMQDALDSLYLGLGMYFEIGKGKDDYIGSMPQEDIFYSYNGDSVDENGFENTPPVVGVFRIGGTDAYWDWPSVDGEKHFMRVHLHSDNELPATAFPILTTEWHGFFSGHWGDGSPLRTGNYGYHPQETSPALCCAYPGLPGDTLGWSESTAGIAPGLRRAMLMYRYPRMDYDDQYRANYCFTWARHPDSSNAVGWALDQFRTRKFIIKELTEELSNTVSKPPCMQFNVASLAPEMAAPDIKIYPNPGSGLIRVFSPRTSFSAIRITDLSGKKMYEQADLRTSNIELDFPLPSGVYFLTVLTNTNQRHTQKIVVVR